MSGLGVPARGGAKRLGWAPPERGPILLPLLPLLPLLLPARRLPRGLRHDVAKVSVAGRGLRHREEGQRRVRVGHVLVQLKAGQHAVVDLQAHPEGGGESAIVAHRERRGVP